jgi:glycopeptide antibiotics resistance protein
MSSQVENSDIYTGMEVFKGMLNTFIRIMPLGLYFFTYFSLTLFQDLRAGVLLLGLVMNELFGFALNKYSGKPYNQNCAVFGSNYTNTKLAFLNNSHIEIISFVTAFFVSDMWKKGTIDWLRFNFLLFMTIVTIWSRMAIGCQNDLKDVIFNVLFGVLIGGLFYYFFSDYYRTTEKGSLEKEACDLGYSDYQCETIQNGTVIVRQPYQNESTDETQDVTTN